MAIDASSHSFLSLLAARVILPPFNGDICRWHEKPLEAIRAMEAEVAKKSESIVIRLRAKGEAPPLEQDGYFLKRSGGATAGAGAK